MSDFEYKKIENGISIIKYTGEETVINIPDKIDGLPVISIGSKAFAENHHITSVTIPDSVANIKKNALDCYDIKKIIFTGRKNLDEIELDDEWKGISNPKIVFKPKKTGFFGLFKS